MTGCTAGQGGKNAPATPSASAATSAPSQAASDGACPSVPAGKASGSVKVAGAFLKTPKVTFTKPLKASGFQRSYVIKGTGTVTAASDTVDIALAAYNGVTGKALSVQGFGSSPVLVTAIQSVVPGVQNAVDCVPVGSRVVLTSTVSQAFGGVTAPSQWKLKKTDSIVFVADVTKILPQRADGVVQHDLPKNMPTVAFAPSGQPKVTLPKSAPPTKTTIVDLRKGDGATVQSGDLVTVQYQGVNW
ncbi:MAG TPA: peptidylprolyl isomerase, partial [Microbacteriaceae bacterium]|nr:peptidylprolyl isomerase [Microbacteriaceae bacterium]